MRADTDENTGTATGVDSDIITTTDTQLMEIRGRRLTHPDTD